MLVLSSIAADLHGGVEDVSLVVGGDDGVDEPGQGDVSQLRGVHREGRQHHLRRGQCWDIG